MSAVNIYENFDSTDKIRGGRGEGGRGNVDQRKRHNNGSYQSRFSGDASREKVVRGEPYLWGVGKGGLVFGMVFT